MEHHTATSFAVLCIQDFGGILRDHELRGVTTRVNHPPCAEEPNRLCQNQFANEINHVLKFASCMQRTGWYFNHLLAFGYGILTARQDLVVSCILGSASL